MGSDSHTDANEPDDPIDRSSTECSDQGKAKLPSWIVQLLAKDKELAQAVREVDRSLIHLAMKRSYGEKLRAGVAMARFAAKFRR